MGSSPQEEPNRLESDIISSKIASHLLDKQALLISTLERIPSISYSVSIALQTKEMIEDFLLAFNLLGGDLFDNLLLLI